MGGNYRQVPPGPQTNSNSSPSLNVSEYMQRYEGANQHVWNDLRNPRTRDCITGIGYSAGTSRVADNSGDTSEGLSRTFVPERVPDPRHQTIPFQDNSQGNSLALSEEEISSLRNWFSSEASTSEPHHLEPYYFGLENEMDPRVPVFRNKTHYAKITGNKQRRFTATLRCVAVCGRLVPIFRRISANLRQI